MAEDLGFVFGELKRDFRGIYRGGSGISEDH